MTSLETNTVMTNSFKRALKRYIVGTVYRERNIIKAREEQFQKAYTGIFRRLHQKEQLLNQADIFLDECFNMQERWYFISLERQAKVDELKKMNHQIGLEIKTLKSFLV